MRTSFRAIVLQNTYIYSKEYRAVSGVFRTIFWPHTPFLNQRVWSTPAPKAGGGGYTIAGRWGGGEVNISEDARYWIGLLQYNPSTPSSQCFGIKVLSWIVRRAPTPASSPGSNSTPGTARSFGSARRYRQLPECFRSLSINSWDRREICHHLKKFTFKGTLRQVFICLWPRNILIHTGTGGGGREIWIREKGEKGRGATVHQAGSKIPTWLNISPVYKLW
jgi:hypothetical protein